MTYQKPPEGWFTFGHHADQPTVVLEFSSEVGDDGLPLWERPKVEEAEEEKVGVLLQYATGNQIGGQPQVIGVPGEVTVSGVMELVAIIERGGLVNPESCVNEAESAVFDLLQQAAYSDTFEASRDIVAVLAEKGLLRQ
jgi:hypothetical protein